MKKVENWYDSADIITCLIITTIFLSIICSQSFANGEFSFTLFSSVINRNSIYLLILIYFVLLRFSFGKRYFNYLNIFLIFVYFITTVTSFLTLVQSFSLVSVLSFVLNFVLFIYSSHTLLRGTRFWKEFRLYSSPFNELTNEGVFYSTCVISVFLLAVNLISTVVVSGVVLSLLDTIYYLLFGRYVYLYYEYLDSKKIDSNNDGNFDEFRGKVQELLDKTEIDDVIVDGSKEVKETISGDKPKEEKEVKEKKSTKKKSVKKGE